MAGKPFIDVTTWLVGVMLELTGVMGVSNMFQGCPNKEVSNDFNFQLVFKHSLNKKKFVLGFQNVACKLYAFNSYGDIKRSRF